MLSTFTECIWLFISGCFPIKSRAWALPSLLISWRRLQPVFEVERKKSRTMYGRWLWIFEIFWRWRTWHKKKDSILSERWTSHNCLNWSACLDFSISPDSRGPQTKIYQTPDSIWSRHDRQYSRGISRLHPRESLSLNNPLHPPPRRNNSTYPSIGPFQDEMSVPTLDLLTY